MSFNILISSVSRKTWQVNAFQQALKKENIHGKVISVDADPLSPGLYLSDKHYLVPSSTDINFIPLLFKICQKEKVKLIIPTRDNELMLFANNKSFFNSKGIKVMVSDPAVIKVCRDKYYFYQFLKKNHLPGPRTFLPNQLKINSLTYPMIIKSRKGSGGKSVFKINNQAELNVLLKLIPDPLIQEFIKGKEYTIDLFSDFDKKVITIVPRERIEVFGGESWKGKTVKDNLMIAKAKTLAEKLGTIGHITIQCLKNKRGIKFIEVNPRFGGGMNLGVRAGANTPLLLLKLALGKKVNTQIGKFEENMIMLRYAKDLFIKNGKILLDK